MRRVLLIGFVSLLALLAAVAGAALYLVHNEDFLKTRLSAFVLEASGRELAVDGDLRVDLGRETVIEASGIRLANAAWADAPDMLRLGRLRLAVDLPSLFGPPAVLPELLLEDCRLGLLENADGQNNWAALAGPQDTEAEPSPGDGLPVRLLHTRIANCVIEHDSPQRQQPLRVAVDEFELSLDGDRWQAAANGRVNEEALSLAGRLEPAEALVRGGPAEFALEVAMGQVELHGEGRVRDLFSGADANLALTFSGPELANVLSHLDLPAFSDGPFDLQLSLEEQGGMTRLKLDGDLGRLQADAEGQFDRLARPTAGTLQAQVSGPDLQALGRALGVKGLAAGEYRLETTLDFAPGRVQVDALELQAGEDTLTAEGAVGTGAGLPGSDLLLKLAGADLGRWSGTWGGQPPITGAFALDGRFRSDAAGLFAFTGVARLDQAELTLDGALGYLSGPLQSDLILGLNAQRPRPLAAWAGIEDFPDAPLSLQGRMLLASKRLTMDDLHLALGSHRARLDGVIALERPYRGSELAVELDSPSAADLGRLFGREGLPEAAWTATARLGLPDQRLRFQGLRLDLADHRLEADGYVIVSESTWNVDEIEARLSSPDLSRLGALFGESRLPAEPLDLHLSLQRQGAGLRFSARQADAGDIRLDASGDIPDLARPLMLNADIDLRLPRLAILGHLVPNFPWPDQPVAVQGALRNREDRVELTGVKLRSGGIRAEVTGEIDLDRRFVLDIAARGGDATELEPWTGLILPAGEFSLDTRLTGSPQRLEFAGIEAELGESRAAGDLQVALGGAKRLSGSLQSEYLDLDPWLGPAGEEPATVPVEAQPRTFVFDDTPIRDLADFGWQLDLDAQVARARLGTGELRDVAIGIRVTDQRLEIQPFSLIGAFGGHSSGRLLLDYAGATASLDLELRGEGVRSGLFSSPGLPTSSVPEVDLELMLNGTGHTRRELASGLDGRIRLYVGPGLVASSSVEFLFTDFLTELFELLNPFAEKSTSTPLECAVAAADVVDGRMDVFPVVVNTDALTIFSRGSIDLRSEKIALSFNTKPRKGLGITTGVLINPLIKVGGTLASPAIEFDPANAIVSGGTAVATAGLSILAKGFADRFLASRDPCGDARKEIAKRGAQ